MIDSCILHGYLGSIALPRVSLSSPSKRPFHATALPIPIPIHFHSHRPPSFSPKHISSSQATAKHLAHKSFFHPLPSNSSSLHVPYPLLPLHFLQSTFPHSTQFPVSIFSGFMQEGIGSRHVAHGVGGEEWTWLQLEHRPKGRWEVMRRMSSGGIGGGRSEERRL